MDQVDEPTRRHGPDGVTAISSLGEPTRRALYDFVVDSADWVSRDRAAEVVGIERGTAAHHLDRLAADGLLDVDYQRLSGRQGPGAGRPAKLYRRARHEIDVSLPQRDYVLAGRLLAEAADRSRQDGTDIQTALDDAARSEGRRLADEVRARLTGAGAVRGGGTRSEVLEVLGAHGFEPIAGSDGTVVLRNCPFHQLAREHTELICGMNQCLLSAAVEVLDGAGLEARLEPEEGMCCVRLHPVGRQPAG
ncbi:MAG TPA: transcriptional regulator [Ilumatobacteraceae bacterium]|nr:transcriptional regulator [Ilumatobacteraceae bacterium]